MLNHYFCCQYHKYMLHKTRAIALHSIKYTDNSIIVNVYTEKFGRQSYLLKGVYGKKATVKANLFAPLNLLELEVYHKSGGNLHKLKEATNFPVFQSIPADPLKLSLSFFLAEMLYKVFQEEIPNEGLFQFVFHAIQILDAEQANKIANFHLLFLIGLSKYAGFFPDNNFSANEKIFDLLNGTFVELIPEHGHHIPKDYGIIWSQLIKSNFDSGTSIIMDREKRLLLLDKIIEYFRLHIPGMSNLKSLQVLKEIYND